MFLLFLVLALVGAQDIEDCKENRALSRCASIFENIHNCFNSNYSHQLEDCLVTCKACDMYSCKNPQEDSELNCTALKGQCESPVWQKFMRERCPATCGKCDEKNYNLCNDKTPDICAEMKQFCNSVDYYDQMTQECPSTCNRCPNEGTNTNKPKVCADKAKDCKLNEKRCTDPKYSDFMANTCAKTCAKCTNSCYDADPRCSFWINKGFCTNPTYALSYKKKYCAKSCKLC